MRVTWAVVEVLALDVRRVLLTERHVAGLRLPRQVLPGRRVAELPAHAAAGLAELGVVAGETRRAAWQGCASTTDEGETRRAAWQGCASTTDENVVHARAVRGSIPRHQPRPFRRSIGCAW